MQFFSEEIKDLIVMFYSDFALSQGTRKTHTCYIICLYGTAISWKSSSQLGVALSTTEEEYITLTEALKESFLAQRYTDRLRSKVRRN